MSGEDFPRTWQAEILKTAPLIAPARQFTYPRAVAGEEDALARGALQVMVTPARGGSFLATCALGFRDPGMPSGVWACPRAEEMCAVVGGYGYIVDTSAPERSDQVPLRPVVQVIPAPEAGVLVFVGLHAVVGWGSEGMAWQTPRLSWEGIRVSGIEAGGMRGFGWDMLTDKELEFVIDLRTGRTRGGAFQNPGV